MADRVAILSLLKNRAALESAIDVHAAAEDTDGFTGADLRLLVKEAALFALRESLETKITLKRHFDAALAAMKLKVEGEPRRLEIYDRFAGRLQ